jgi:DNA-binding NarL/FixJ family response regulator
MHLLFGTGGGTAELASKLLRERYGSLLIALKQIERGRADVQGEATQPAPKRSAAPSSESAGSPKWSAERLAEVRRKHPRAYDKWTTAEDDRLKDMLSDGAAVAQIARELERQPSAIRSRLNRLGLVGTPTK